MATPQLNNEQRAELANEWAQDEDGILSRDAARVVIFGANHATYLIKGHDFGDTNHSWWFTVGGGIAPGETPVAGACRELFEETGLRIDPERLAGPVLRRHATFHFVSETRRQHELFFITKLTDSEMNQIGASTQLTALEHEVLDEFKWWSLPEILEAQDRGETFYPQNFAEFAQSWSEGWDGECVEIWEA